MEIKHSNKDYYNQEEIIRTNLRGISSWKYTVPTEKFSNLKVCREKTYRIDWLIMTKYYLQSKNVAPAFFFSIYFLQRRGTVLLFFEKKSERFDFDRYSINYLYLFQWPHKLQRQLMGKIIKFQHLIMEMQVQ